MGGKVKDKLEDGVTGRKERLEHAIEVKNLDLILKAGCALTLLEKGAKGGKKIWH